MTTGHTFNCLLQVSIDVGVVQNRFRVNPNVVVDDELQPSQPNALIRDLAKVKSQLWVAHVHHDLDINRWHGATLHFSDFSFQQAVVNVAGVAFSAAHRD